MANLKETIEKVEAVKEAIPSLTPVEIKEALDFIIKDLNEIRNNLLPIQDINI